MPLYFFGLPDDLALPEVGEELANDAEARQVAQIVRERTQPQSIRRRGSGGIGVQ